MEKCGEGRKMYRLTLADLGMPKAMFPGRCWDEYLGGGLPYESDGDARLV